MAVLVAIVTVGMALDACVCQSRAVYFKSLLPC